MTRTHSHRLAFATLFAGLALTFVAPPARAGELDVQLLGWGRENVLYILHQHNAPDWFQVRKKYRNVGVLPFEVVKGPKDRGYETAPISLNVVPRLENALILGQDSAGDVIGIVRDATSTATAEALRSYQGGKCDKKDFDKLFATKYDRAWGDKKVTVDAFLTGTIVNPHPDDPRKVQVIIKVIDPTCWDAKESRVKEPRYEFRLSVNRDRDLLADLGIAYVVPPVMMKRFLSRDVLPSERDEMIKPLAVTDKTLANVGGFSVELFYKKAKGDKGDDPKLGTLIKMKTVKDPKYGAIFEVPPPEVGDKVSVVLTRKDNFDRKLGVVLKVNDKSVWQMQDADNLLCDKWLFNKDEKSREVFNGFYFDVAGKNFQEFKVIPKSEADRMGNKAGWIDVEVFAEASTPQIKDDPDDKETATVSTKRISSRSVGSVATRKGGDVKWETLTSLDLPAVQTALKKANNIDVKPSRYPLGGDSRRSASVAVATRNIISSTGKAMPGPAIKTGEKIPSPESIGRIQIRYYNSEK
jgi:hypothetical protein